jgi:predicted transcriptional regulator
VSHVITIRLDDETTEKLDMLARYLDRSRWWLAAKAIERYLESAMHFFDFLDEGEKTIANGDFITHDDLVSEMRSLGRGSRAA